jgi:COP9 signalosome complex subunit 1
MSTPTQDLDAYASRYEGRGRISRLRFVAWRSSALELDALRLAIDAAKRGKDTALYKELVQLCEGRLGPDYVDDELWVSTTDKWAASELERLRRELDDARTQQHNKEVIRASLSDLGDFFYSRGKLSQARGENITMRDYCTDTKHHVSMSMKVIQVCLEASEFHHVENYVHMAENIPDAATQSALELSYMRCCAGVALLARGRYKDAATRFLTACIDTSEDKSAAVHALFNDAFCVEDVATYAGLCALATLDRKTLIQRVLGSGEFRALLDLVPDVRELVNDFCATRYTSSIAYLEKLRPDLLLDPFLGRDDHLDVLYRRIQSKALVQYVQPFESVDIEQMAAVFQTEVRDLENTLFELIENGAIDARIDTQHRSLHRKTTNMRSEALSKALVTGENAFEEVEAMLLRMSLTKSGMSVAWQQQSLSRASSGMGQRSLPDSMLDASGILM